MQKETKKEKNGECKTQGYREGERGSYYFQVRPRCIYPSTSGLSGSRGKKVHVPSACRDADAHRRRTELPDRQGFKFGKPAPAIPSTVNEKGVGCGRQTCSTYKRVFFAC